MAGNAHARRHNHQKGCAMCERQPGTVIKRARLAPKPKTEAKPKKEKKTKI